MSTEGKIRGRSGKVLPPATQVQTTAKHLPPGVKRTMTIKSLVVAPEKGRITPNGVVLERHELSTIVFFTDLGEQVELIPTAADFSMKTPDFMMGGLAWEMKSPAGDSRTTIEHVFRRAAHQSQNIVMDLRRTEISDKVAVKILEQRLGQSHWVKHVKVITKTCNLIDLEKVGNAKK